MIPAKSEYQTESSMVGEKISMGIDTASLAFIQTILTDLYSDPELAVLRELSTNARDAHMEAGHTKPIEIRLPNSMNPSITIKDYGIGLSLDDIRKVYSLYGASTKRENELSNGMLGLGSKSPLTYTNQFTVRAVKDGVLTSVLVTRDDDGASSMQILQQVDTDEANGVQITVPTKPRNSFHQKAHNFFKYWIDSPVPALIDGESPKFIDATWIDENIAIFRGDSYYDRKIYVHMAGVTYTVRDHELTNLGLDNWYSVVFYVKPGSVDFTPNREDLHYTKRTKEVIAEFTGKLRKGLKAAVSKDVASAKTAQEAISVFRQWKKRLTFQLGDTITWNGKTSPDMVEWTEWYSIRPHQPNFYSKDGETGFLALPDDLVIVTGKSVKGISNAQRAKLRTWMEDEYESSNADFIFVDKDKHSPWTDVFEHVKWSEIIAIKPTANKSSAGRSTPEHYVLRSSYYRTKIDPKTEVETSKPIGYASLQEISSNDDAQWGRLAQMVDAHIYMIPKAKIKAFIRLYPSAKPYKEMLADQLHKVYATFTDAEKTAIKEEQALQSAPNTIHCLAKYDLDIDVLDPNIKMLMDRINGIDYKSYNQAAERLTKFQELMRHLSERTVGDKWSEYYALAWKSETYSNMFDEYILISNIWNWSKPIAKHVVIYINAMYENKIKEQNAKD